MKISGFVRTNCMPLVLSLFLAVNATAGNIPVGESGPNKLKVTESNYSLLSITNSLSDIEYLNVKTKEGYFTLFKINSYGYSTAIGNPKLPVIKRLIEVPLNASIDVEILSHNEEEVNLEEYGITNLVMPAQPPLSKSIDNPDDVEFIFNQAAYEANEFFGPEMVQVIDLGVVRGVRMARIEIAPVYYNPVQNALKVFTDITLKVNFKDANVTATLTEKEDKFSPFYESIYSQFINYKPLEGKELITTEPVTYIIVSDPMFEEALIPFVEWKIKKGFQVVEAYTDNPDVGSTTTSIKNYLKDFYENPPEGYNSQSFVLFVGDIEQIPPFDGDAGWHVTDLYFCTYDGDSDIYPDCYYGRFSANNLTELQPQIDKTLEYEQYLFPDASFLDEVVMIAGADATFGPLYGNGQINYGTDNYFNAAHGLTSHTYLQPEPNGSNYSQDIRSDISNGVGYANYTAHCNDEGWHDPSFKIYHISQLSNEGKYPLMVGKCCSSVEFQTTCFGEEILRAENKGAIGYIGGSNSTYWDEDFWWGVGFEEVSVSPSYDEEHLGAYDRLFHENDEVPEEWYVTQGQMPSAGNLAVTQAGSIFETYYWEIYHLMGDPSVMIYFSQPPMAGSDYQSWMPLGSPTFTVNTDPYAYVAISKDGVLHGCAVADESGVAEVMMFNPISIPGDADVVITGQNLGPFIGTVEVDAPDGAYVLLEGFSIDDSEGNNNGQADFNENITLDISLENLGNETASNVTASISTMDEYVTLSSNNVDWPDITAGDISTQASAFAVVINELIPDGHKAIIDIEITDGTDTWTGSFQLFLNAPVLTIGSYSVDDSNGNGDGRLDPGENADIIVSNFNEGGCDALGTMATFISENPLITVNNATFDVETIGSGESVNAIFNITVDEFATDGEVVTAVYELTSGPFVVNSLLSLSIGLIVEDFESDSFDSYPWEFGGNADWYITNQEPYEGDFTAQSGNINDNGSSSMLVTMDVATDDEIAFYLKVSSEGNYDYLRFYIDGLMKEEWSGEVPWVKASFEVTSGSHAFEWKFEKDYSVSNGSDCAWIDFIVFPPNAGAAPLGVIATAYPEEICQGEYTELFAWAMGGNGEYTYAWEPTEGLSDPAIANPIASPEVTTTYSVTVSDGDAIITDDLEIIVHPAPATPTISQSGINLVSSSADGNQWYNSSGPITGAIQQYYTPDATDDYYVIVTSQYNCISEPSEYHYFVFTGIIDIAEGQNVNVYPNPFSQHFTLDYSLKSNSKVKITIFNTFGQLITVIEDKNSKMAGNHRMLFDTGRYEAGIFYLKIETDDYSLVKRIIHKN